MIQPEVGDPVQDLAGVQVHLVRDLLGDLHQEPAVDVQHALRPAGRAARVADEQRMLAVERVRSRSGRAAPASSSSQPTSRRTRRRRRVGPEPPPRHDALDAPGGVRGAAAVSLIGTGEPLRSDPSAVISTRQPASAESSRDRIGAEAAEDRHPDRAELRARHDRRHGLDRHRHEDADRVASTARPSERSPFASRSVMRAELRVGGAADLAVLGLPDRRRRPRAFARPRRPRTGARGSPSPR